MVIAPLVKAVKKAFRPRETKRLERELQNLRALSKDSSVNADLVKDDLSHWKGTIGGTENTPYQGGLFTIDIHIPSDYPFDPPKMKFDTKIWHPQVSPQTGAICVGVLGKEWSPALTIRTVLLSLQAMLSTPDPSHFQGGEAENQYNANREKFTQTAKHWTENFAKDTLDDDDAKVKQMVSMGVCDEAKARLLIKKHKGDLTLALDEALE